MAYATIYRPQYQIDFQDDFTTLPNALFNLGRYFQDVKPLHSSVYNYLLTKKQSWKIVPQDIANAFNIHKSTASRALTKLRALGLISFQRSAKGGGEWIVKVPDFLLSHSQVIEKSPLPQKPQVEKPQAQNDDALVITKEVESIKETTNSVVVIEEKTTEVYELVVTLPSVIDTAPVKKDLMVLIPQLQILVLTEWMARMKKGGQINPIGLVRHFVKLAKNGELKPSVDKPVDKPLSFTQLQEKKEAAKNQAQQTAVSNRVKLLDKYKEAIRKAFTGQEMAAFVPGVGMIMREEILNLL